MKSPSTASSSPTGACSDRVSRPWRRISSTFSAVIDSGSPISSEEGSRPSDCVRSRRVRVTLVISSAMWTGTRMVRPWSASARCSAWRIHQVAYVENL